MGKKMMKGYKIFILFFLMSMSVFGNSLTISHINLGEYPEITLTLEGDTGEINEINNFSENRVELDLELSKFNAKRVDSGIEISYTSYSIVSPRDTVNISFNAVDKDWKGRDWKDEITYVSKEYVVPDNISVASVDVTKYYENQEIKIILEGNSGNKTILNNGIKETSGSGTIGTVTPTGNSITEVNYITPIKSGLEPGDTVTVEFILYEGDIEYPIVTSYIVPENISVASIDVTKYYENQEIKIILEGRGGNKTILAPGIQETSGSSTTVTVTHTGNIQKEIIYTTPIESGLEPGDIVTVEFDLLYEEEMKYPIETTYTVPLEITVPDPTIPEITGTKRTEVEEVSSENYKEIKINLISITKNDMKSMELKNVKETREEQDSDLYPNITAQKVILEKVKINGVTYNLDENNKTTETVPGFNGKQYIYGWEGTYITEFTDEKGEERTVSFNAQRTLSTNNSPIVYNLSGSYIEPLAGEELTPKPSEQWIYSQITKDNLVKTDKYIVDFYERLETIKTIDEDGSLDELLKPDVDESVVVSVDGEFIQEEEKKRYKYEGEPKSIVEFKINSNIGEPEKGKFELTIVENNVFKRKINESYVIPVPTTNFKEEKGLELSKNIFTYKDNYELEHIKAYNYQEVLFRLYTGSKHNEVRPIKIIEEKDFDLSGNNYIDFVFENNGSVQEIEKNGIKGRFIEGKFEIMGLENKNYNLDFYTLRYRAEADKKIGNYVAVTYEGSIVKFKGKNISSTEDAIWLEDIDISEYKTIKLNMISVTTEDLRELDILDLNEIRGGETEFEDTRSIAASKILLNEIWIGGEKYEVKENHITLNGENKYVYKWIGSYKTEFEQKNGEIREINFWSRRYSTLDETYEDKFLTGKYIEPSLPELDTGDAHQWVMFEFDSVKEFKKQDYKIEDRVSSPERKGYKKLKTVDYESTRDDILYGKSGYSSEKEFTYNNGVWSYPEQTSSEGLIIEKTITESKGIIKGEGVEDLLFYTDNKGDGIEKTDESGNKVTFRWNEGLLNTNGEILSYDKIIFRIVKTPNIDENTNTVKLPKYYWNPYTNDNPINYLDDKSDGDARLEAFLYGDKNYVDVVLDASTSKTMTFINAIISYEQTNKKLRIVGLPVGNYNIQFYSVKRGHDDKYKVITREDQSEDQSEFKMDISDISSLEFEKEKNIHKIDFITTGTSSGAIQVNVNFITKMEREIELTVNNLKSGYFNMEETKESNEGSGDKKGIGEAGKITLKESEMKRILFPLDVVFVIDNSASMQEEINAVKNGLTAFGQELYNRGFDVKYNLITFGPRQNNSTIGDWYSKGYATTTYDRGYMAIYKDGTENKWFNGSTKEEWHEKDKDGKDTSVLIIDQREKELAELKDAFSKIRANSGYYGGQENSAWGIHHAIDKLHTNGRYLSYSGEIVKKGESGAYMPSEKMIIFLTDEDMDKENLPSGYEGGNVLQQLYSKLNITDEETGMSDNIDLNGIFHIRKRGNTAQGASGNVTTYDKEDNHIVPGLRYKYSTGKQQNGREYYMNDNKNNYRIGQESGGKAIYYNDYNNSYWEEWDDNEIPIRGEDVSNVFWERQVKYDPTEISHTDFKLHNSANNFFMYEMGTNGEHVSKALTLSINNLGIIQRWDLSYLTPFNEYDGTTRTIDFELVGVKGKDKKSIGGEITNLNKKEDKQYTVKEEKLALEFVDPSIDNLKLTVVDDKGTITFRGKARYNEFPKGNNNEPIIVEEVIREYKLDVLDSNDKLLFSRNTDNIKMKLSDDESVENAIKDRGWYEFKIDLTDEEVKILRKSTEKIDLEATIVTDLFNKTERLEDVDISTPKIKKVTLVNKTLKSFLDSMYTIDEIKSIFNKEYSEYTDISPDNIPNNFSGKNGDKIYIELLVEGKDIDENNVANGINIDGWSNPVVEPYSDNGSHEMKKFKVILENQSILGNIEIRDLIIKNNIKRKSGLRALQDVKVLSIDNIVIEATPTVRDIGISPDSIYYVNSDYNLDLETSDDNLRAGIVTMEYDKNQADKDEDENYYGKLDNYYKITDENIFGGGKEKVKDKSISFLVKVDGIEHTTDGEYITQVYGMSKSGKLKGITNYSDGDFRNVMWKSSTAKEIIIRVDTIAPRIVSLPVKESVESLNQDNESYYYFDLSFEIEDFNVNNNKFIEGQGGHKLLGENNEEIGTFKEGVTPITYSLEVKRSDLESGGSVKVTIVAVDKAGNETTKELTISIPKDIKINTYEELHQLDKSKITKDGYKFTKGGLGSNIPNPGIYVTIPSSNTEDEKIGKLKIQKIGEGGSIEGEKIITVSGGDEEKEIEVTFNFGEGVNTVKITPINVSSVEGNFKEFKFVVDTRINSSHLDTKDIIGKIDSEGKIQLRINELSGISKYEYEFILNSGEIVTGIDSVNFESSITEQLNTFKVDISRVAGRIDDIGGVLYITVFDKLGNEKLFSESYAEEKKSVGDIISTISGEVKQRNSKINILTEGSVNKFAVESSIDRSSEYKEDKKEEEEVEDKDK